MKNTWKKLRTVASVAAFAAVSVGMIIGVATLVTAYPVFLGPVGAVCILGGAFGIAFGGMKLLNSMQARNARNTNPTPEFPVNNSPAPALQAPSPATGFNDAAEYDNNNDLSFVFDAPKPPTPG